jgi:hypothetical protein
VSLADLQAALLVEFQRTRDRRWIELSAGALRNLKYRGLISRGPGYNVVELTAYLDARHADDQVAC